MYSPRHLFNIASAGFAEMAPAVRRAFNGDRRDDRLDRVFGPAPRAGIALTIAGGLLAGLLLERAPGTSALAPYVSLPAVLIAAVYALLFRRYLFVDRRRGKANLGARLEAGVGADLDDDFGWLAASLIPASAVLVLASLTGRIFSGGVEVIDGAPTWTQFGGLARAGADSLAVAAALAIAVAALCYSRNWKRALRDLAVRLLVFKITVFVMVLLFVEIGIVGAVLAGLLEALFGVRFPHWLGDFVDQLSYSALMALIYLAVIGAAWTACRRQFGPLLATGESDVLAEIAGLARAKPPVSDKGPPAGTGNEKR